MKSKHYTTLPNVNPVTQIQLDAHGCGCGHDHGIMYIHSRCHTGAGVDAIYLKGAGAIHFVCRECKDTVIYVKVADGR